MRIDIASMALWGTSDYFLGSRKWHEAHEYTRLRARFGCSPWGALDPMRGCLERLAPDSISGPKIEKHNEMEVAYLTYPG